MQSSGSPAPFSHRSGPAPRLALLACSVFEREIAQLTQVAGNASHLAEIQFFEIALHDRPDTLRSTLQQALGALDARNDIEAIALAYGLCGLGTAGLHPLRHRLVFPRVHDCIAIFMGSKERYAEHQAACPSCYYYTPGWNRSRRVPGPDKLEALKNDLADRFDEEDIEFLVETEREQWAQHDTAVYMDLGTEDAESEADYARRCADWLGWKYQRIQGDPTLLRDLLWGSWDDERFQIIEPGCRLGHSPDAAIMRSEPA